MKLRMLFLFSFLSLVSDVSLGVEPDFQERLSIWSSDVFVYSVYEKSFSECVFSQMKAENKGRSEELADLFQKNISSIPREADDVAKLDSFASALRGVNYSLGMPCSLPPSRAEIFGLVSSLRPYLEESERVTRCATGRIPEGEKAGDDFFYPIEQNKNSLVYKNAIVANMDHFVNDPQKNRTEIMGNSISFGLDKFGEVAGDPVNIQAVARQKALYAILLDISLGSGCEPSRDLFAFVGLS